MSPNLECFHGVQSLEIRAQRRDAVEKARQVWIRRLIDLSRRNNLLYYRPLKWGTLSLSRADVERWSELLRGEAVHVKNLVEDLSDEELTSKALSIWRKAQANQEEKGLATLYVALGMASWKTSDGGRNSEAAVLLLPVTFEMKGHAGSSMSLRRAGPVQANLVLMHVLETEFGISISPESTLACLQGSEEEDAFDPSPVYQFLKEASISIPEFEIRDVAILGNFAFQKMAMVKDLQESPEILVSSDIIAALAGDTEAKQSLGAKWQNPDPKEFDTILPQAEFLVLDADSSQQAAIAAVLRGQSEVIHGPPGTGKSQTIANLVASLTAIGKRVLFVAEKRAALQVVLKRLQHVGLEKLAIDLHGADLSPKRVMEQVAGALNAVRDAIPVDCDEMHRRYVERRDRLNRHVESLHRKRMPGGLSVYELQGILLRLPAQAHTNVRWRGSELTKVERAGPAAIRDCFQEAGGLASLFLRRDPSPWNGVQLRDGLAAQQTIDLVARLSSMTWPDLLSSLEEMATTLAAQPPDTLQEVQHMYKFLAGIRNTLEVYSPELFGQNLQEIIRALGPAKNGRLKAAWAWCTSDAYRSARRRGLAFRTAGKVRSARLLPELVAAEDQRIKWVALTNRMPLPEMLDGLSEAQTKLELAVADLRLLYALFPKTQFLTLRLTAITEQVDRMASDRLTPLKLPKLFALENALEESGVGSLILTIRQKQIQTDKWVAAFDFCWYASCLEAAQAEDPEIAGFNGRTHDGFVAEFKELDEERIRVAAARVRRAYAERAVASMNEHESEEFIIRSEAEKRRRHRPLRQLFAYARNVLTAVCPCWMASPLSVSQLLDGTRCFDYVIFDEASQILPEDAVPAIMRGSHVVVAGDRWQLPPTTFFAAADEDELAEDEATFGIEGYESLLDSTNAFLPSWQLNWHYRSRDEALISFSNHYIYKDRLVTFPGPGGSPVVQHVLVEQRLGIDGQEESCSQEVQRIVDLVLDHAVKKPTESLGVIAMGIRHADRVQRALDQALAERHDLSPFFDPTAEERFFVKNLERVQGDERDAIILTVGYGKDRGGNLPFRFGPLLSVGGQRRLNVAVTRARRRMTLVSSFSHLDMDLAKVKRGTGVELLRYYLEYAASGGKRLGDLTVTDFPMNSFEAEVFDVLQSKGISLVPQVGASSYRIDLVAEHPRQKGRYVLAIECDGASYHSSPTARDRDRLRQKQLENLDWRFHRIWSTDWFMRKDEEVQRALAAYEAAVADIDHSQSVSEAPTAVKSLTVQNLHMVKPKGRGIRPNVQWHDLITQYSRRELMVLVDWIQSDGRLRTDDEIIEELLPELGFRRRGVRIETVLKSVLEEYRNRQRAT